MSVLAATAQKIQTRAQYAVIAVLTLLIVLQVVQSWSGPAAPNLQYANVARDFKAFYCAGATANAHKNPYLEAPFQRCGVPENQPLPGFVRSGVWPAPLPPYDVAFFRFFALFPYHVAASLWLLLSLAALWFAVIAISEMSGVAPLGVFAALALTLYYGNLVWGQIPPIVVGALVTSAYALRRTSYLLAGISSVATLLEPNIGVPVCIAVFLWVPRTRLAIAAGAVVLALVSILTLGVAMNVSYFRTILPLQAMSQLPTNNQYSLAWLAYTLGASPHIALQIGSASYIVMAVIGIWLARSASRALRANELVPLIPAGAAVFGGAYVHLTQTNVAIVLGLLLLAYSRSPLIWIGVALQVPVWLIFTSERLFRLESTLAVATFVFFAASSDLLRRRLTAAALAGAVFLVLSSAIHHVPRVILRGPESPVAYARQLGAHREFTAGADGVRTRADVPYTTETLVSVVSKVPVWLGLAMILLATARLRRPQSSAEFSVASSVRGEPAQAVE